MSKFFCLVFLFGCTTTQNLKVTDTKFTDSNRDWSAVYREEIRIAIENGDKEAHYFFIQELVKLKFK